MKLFELRACWEEYYDCPDNGQTKICDTYDTIAYAVDDDTTLRAIADNLEAGYDGDWNQRRAHELKKLYPNYDEFRDTEYKVVDVTDLLLENVSKD